MSVVPGLRLTWWRGERPHESDSITSRGGVTPGGPLLPEREGGGGGGGGGGETEGMRSDKGGEGEGGGEGVMGRKGEREN